jgi:hypothetical protein
MPSSQSEVLLGAGMTIGRPFATLEPLLIPAALGKGPWGRGPAAAGMATEGVTPLMGMAMAAWRLTRAPPTMAAVQTVATRREWRNVMGGGGAESALDSPVSALSVPWIDAVLIGVNRGVEIAQARL